MVMKILVVEDDQAVAQTLQLLLSSYNYAVDVAPDGKVGQQMADAFDYDLILLDVVLPRLDGISLCQQLRTKGFQSPILLLTGQREGRQKAIALNAGADDYVVKPFDAEELMARVQALLRRGGPTSQPILTWGQLSVDPSSRKVAYGTHLLSVTPKEYAILELFLRHPQKLFNAKAILDHAWSSIEFPGEEAVRVHIKELRQKLTAVGAPKDFIKTKHRVGYQLNSQYSNFLAVQVEQQPTAPQIAELSVVNEQLRLALEELGMIQEELQQQNEQLESAQQAIALERQRYQDLFEFAPDAYLVTDIDGVIQEANRAATALFHIAACRLIGKPLLAFIAECDRRDFRLRLAQANLAENWEVNVKPRQVEPFPVLIAATSITTLHNEVIGWRWSLRDIRTRKVMEQQLQAAHDQLELRVAERTEELRTANQALGQREEFLRSIYDGAEQGVFVIEVTEANDFYYSGFNRLAEQLAGNYTSALYGKTPEAAFGLTIGARFRQNYERCLQAGKGISYEEYVVFENHTIWTLTTLSPLQDQQGRIYRIVGTAIDISDRKQLELSLQDSEAKLNQILNSAIVAISSFRVYANRDWEYEYWSAGCERLYGYALAEYADKNFWIAQVLPDDRDQVLMPLFDDFFAERDATAEYRFRRKDGSVRWFSSSYTSRKIADDCWIVTTVNHDISDRKQAEMEIRKFVSLADNSSEFIGMCDLNFVPFYLNAAGRQMLGLEDEQQYPNIQVRDCFFPEDQDFIIHEFFPQVLREGQAKVEIRFRHFQTGATLWMIYNVFCIRDEHEQPIALATLSHNITDRKLAERKIRQQAALLDIATDAIFVRDFNNYILYWNQGAERLYGWQAAEAIGQKANDLFQDPDFPIQEVMQKLLVQGEWRDEIHSLTKMGRQVIVETRWTLVRDETDQPQWILSVDTDITAKKQLEAQFYRAQRLESLGTLASGIAHDLNNVLTPIVAISQLLRLKHLNLDARSQQMLEVLEDSAKRGAHMIQQILTFTRGTGGERHPIQIAPVLQEVVNVVQQTFPRSISIQQMIPEHTPWLVLADSTYLHQVLMNLCVNARDAMPHGGTLSLTIAQCDVDQAFAQTNLDAHLGSYVVITIADTGSGIPLSVRDRIFDPFFTTKPPGQGTGLGLATVLGIVRNYGGFLQVFSEVDHGTQMKVYLPIIAGTPTDPHPRQEHLDGKEELILVVDDDIAVQLSTRSLLESHYYNVVSASDGIEAIELYVRHHHDIKLVILDIMMPKMSGIALIQQLKATNPTVKIIAMSGLPENREPALAAGAKVFLPKPYTLDHLLENLRMLLETTLN